MTINDYTVVCADDPERLSEKVSAALKDGWKLYEAPYCATNKNLIVCYHCQAMVKDGPIHPPVRALGRTP